VCADQHERAWIGQREEWRELRIEVDETAMVRETDDGLVIVGACAVVKLRHEEHVPAGCRVVREMS
jgi:hypothetical protein